MNRKMKRAMRYSPLYKKMSDLHCSAFMTHSRFAGKTLGEKITMAMDDTTLRQYVLAHLPKPKTQPIDTDHTLFPDANLMLKEMSAGDALDIVGGATRPDGSVNIKAMTASVLMACLCNADTGNAILDMGSRDELLAGGMSFVQPLAMQAMELCGLNDMAIGDAKKNLNANPSVSSAGSPPTS